MERLLAASQERGCPVFAAMRDAGALAAFVPRTREAVAGFVKLIERHQAALREGALSPRQWAENFVREIDYEAELRRGEKNQEAADNRVRNLRELLATLGATAGNTAAQVEGFLDDLSLDSEREEEEEQTGDAVTLITMHSCKGLEFPHVYIVGLEDGLLPHSRSKEEGTLDEERRLFYVALTRAMLTLTLSHCAARKKYGQPLPCHPSPFLRELPAELLELADEKSNALVSVEAGREGFAAMRRAAGGKENGEL
jgi:superfamily I DNA/RNA helicase